MDNNRFVEGEIQIHREARCILFPSLLAICNTTWFIKLKYFGNFLFVCFEATWEKIAIDYVNDRFKS